MQREIMYDSLDAFVLGLKGRGITKIAFGETSEKRPEQVEPGVLHVVHVDRVDLVAYRDSVLYKCSLRDVDRGGLHEMLTAEGFEVTRLSRNIT
jgi:hypothetical protein